MWVGWEGLLLKRTRRQCVEEGCVASQRLASIEKQESVLSIVSVAGGARGVLWVCAEVALSETY